MANNENSRRALEKFIEKSVKQGRNIEEIKKYAVGKGWPENQVHEVYKDIKKKGGIKKKNFSKTILIVSILIFVFLIGYFILNVAQSKSYNSKLLEELKKEGLIDREKLIQECVERDVIGTCMALATGNLDYCGKQDSIDLRSPEECRDEYYFRVAIKTKDKSYCEKTTTSALACQAIITGNLEKCEEFESDYGKKVCLAVLGGDEVICQELENITQKKDCIDQIYYKKAIEADDITECGKLNLDNDVIHCKAFLQGDSKICEEEVRAGCENDLNSQVDLYIFNFAEHYNTNEVCDMILDQSMKENCKLKI